ncbi:4Fe-4S binding protein [Sphaerochaeta sp.]|uniref:4Fe-4S binding protein n=1 Tax=Sphaerochaeta sp. TaxID=1972642 RepID=UPI002FC93FE8
MKSIWQRTVQTLSFLLFVFLVLQGKVQLWMAVFLVSTLLVLFFSRLYCGWLCPINSVLIPVSLLKKKLRVKNRKTPALVKKGSLRILMLLLFVALMLVSLKTGRKLPVLPALVGVALLVSLFFEEALWHRWLCPYGAILSLPGRAAKHHMTIDSKRCTNCTHCAKVCPSQAIIKEEKHRIIKHECLVCHACERVCTKDAISYR